MPQHDPFEQLVAACKETLDFVRQRRTAAEASLETRTSQERRLVAAIEALTGESTAKATATRPKRNLTPEQRAQRGRCPNCGYGYRGFKHRNICVLKTEVAEEAPVPFVLSSVNLEERAEAIPMTS